MVVRLTLVGIIAAVIIAAIVTKYFHGPALADLTKGLVGGMK